LGRYLAGESTPDEAAQVRRWLSEDPSRQTLVQTLERSTTELRAKAPANLDVAAALTSLTARMNEPRILTFRARAEAWSAEWGSTIVRIAAVLLLAVGGTALWQSFSSSLAPERRYATAVGHTNTITLSDGSRIILGPQSRITVLGGYLASGREVELTGEAFFDVRHNPAMPFRVRVGSAVIEDIGTTFDVRADGTGEVQVVVASGSVSLQDTTQRHQSAMLRAGDRGTLVRGAAPQVQHGADTALDLAWTQGRIRFDNAPVSRVQAELRRWYGIELQMADSALAARHVTASFSTEPGDQVVKIIALTLGATVEQRGDTALMRALPGGAARR
jgi:transmembrane sensor